MPCFSKQYQKISTFIASLHVDLFKNLDANDPSNWVNDITKLPRAVQGIHSPVQHPICTIVQPHSRFKSQNHMCECQPRREHLDLDGFYAPYSPAPKWSHHLPQFLPFRCPRVPILCIQFTQKYNSQLSQEYNSPKPSTQIRPELTRNKTHLPSLIELFFKK